MRTTVAAMAMMAFAGAGGALAQNNSTTGAGSSSTMKLSQSECTSLWQQAAGSSSAGLTADKAKPYVTDFKAANPDGDTTIDQNEFMTACNKGLVKPSSASGASSGSSGSSTGNSSSGTAR